MYDLADAYKVWRVPARFSTCTPGRWARQGQADYPQEWALCYRWLSQFRRYLADSPDTLLHGHGLCLMGDTGVGKTMLAASFLNYLHNKGFSTAFVRDGDLSHLLSLRYPDEDQDELIMMLRRVACVVVDDLGRTPESIEWVEPFLRYRMDEAKPTIVTVNARVPLTATLESILHEYTFVPFTGVDRRKSPLEPHHARW